MLAGYEAAPGLPFLSTEEGETVLGQFFLHPPDFGVRFYVGIRR